MCLETALASTQGECSYMVTSNHALLILRCVAAKLLGLAPQASRLAQHRRRLRAIAGDLRVLLTDVEPAHSNIILLDWALTRVCYIAIPPEPYLEGMAAAARDSRC